MAERPPTQFLPLESQDFGPEQEEAGARIRGLARPPPTETIRTHVESVRSSADVLSEIGTTQRALSVQSRRIAKRALSIWVATIDSAVRLAREARAPRERAVERMSARFAAPLSVRPAAGAPIAASLEAGAIVLVYPEVEAPEGWIAAQARTGELGYVRADLLTKV